jgi:hypothetical protein
MDLLCTLEDKTNERFHNDLGITPIGPITSFTNFLRLFLKHWELHLENEDIEMFIQHTIASTR